MSSENKFLDLCDYQILHSIGKGSFSIVYLVKNQKSKLNYAAKVSLYMVDEETANESQTFSVFHEVNLMSILDHPAILKYIGYSQTNFENYPLPTIVTEYATNGSLYDILEMEKSGLSPNEWNLTKKLIIVYGIASGISYMHHHKVIHRDLKPQNILLDELLYPKISDFGLSKINDFLSISMNIQSQKGLKGTPLYMSPEIINNEEYSEASDVYAFAFIIFELFTLEEPFTDIKTISLMRKICNGDRPQIKEYVPHFFSDLIECCWSQDPKNRPSFAEIVNEMKESKEIINEVIDEAEFYDYVDYIENCKTSFDTENKLLHFKDFIKVHGRNKDIKIVSIKKADEEKSNKEKIIYNNSDEREDKDTTTATFKEEEKELNKEKIIYNNSDDKEVKDLVATNFNKKEEELNKEKALLNNSDERDEKVSFNKESDELIMEQENDYEKLPVFSLLSRHWQSRLTENEEKLKQNNEEKEHHLFYPYYEFINLSEKCQNIVEEAENDPKLQFELSISLFEGSNDFPKNISLALKYLNKSIDCNYFESIIYYVNMLIKGSIISKNLKMASQILSKNDLLDDVRLIVLKGKIAEKEKKYSEAINYYKKGIEKNDIESMYHYAKMLFLGQGIRKNDKETFKYFNKSSILGNQISQIFLQIFVQLKEIKEFKKLKPETQFLFILNDQLKNEYIFDQIKIKPNKTEMLFYNNSLKNIKFIDFLARFKSSIKDKCIFD